MYTIKQLADLSGVTTRTLRHYDAIGLFQPTSYSDAGYRLYAPEQTLVLQQILLYRDMGLSLPQIQAFITDEQFSLEQALQNHYVALQQQAKQLEQKMHTVEKTLQYIKGEVTMTQHEQFEGFKKQQIEQNEQAYGQEIRQKYGEESVMAAYGKMKDMTEVQYEAAQRLESQVFSLLRDMLVAQDDETMLEIAELHKRWLSMYWPKYTTVAHAGLASMYIADERFTAYYDERAGVGATQLLYEAIMRYTSRA
ncbi:MerR family transcriptional regulator [Caryophanon tenue]|uniref:MerR family transcriptional regulator n=1 Tax=Caryophanon tenue TaxID=33978 RepID=A0A1C0YM61_9BACL|nr:MerR family transcriptional regulator [Caryophanon tenue]OCS88265.1 MerR family transcriptional regulator [Caryophanon tenue]